jgi:hypothetical protein
VFLITSPKLFKKNSKGYVEDFIKIIQKEFHSQHELKNQKSMQAELNARQPP